ncbi:MAG: sensor domain-containing diguanylate cyclase [Clostridiaceae bacterium]
MSKNSPTQTDLSVQLKETLLSEIPCGVCVARADERMTLVFANESFCAMFGYAVLEEAQRDGFTGALDRFSASDTAAVNEIRRFIQSESPSLETEVLQRRRDGSLFWAMIRVHRAAFEGGVLVCAVMDVTSQKEAEEELRIREEEYRIAVRQSGKLVLRYDIAKQSAFLTPETAERLGQSVLLGLPENIVESGLIKADSMEAYRRLHEEIVSGRNASGSAVLELNISALSASGNWYRADYSIIYGSDGAPAQAVVSLQNISEQYERELAYKKWEQTYASLPQGQIAYLEFDLTRNRFETRKGGLIGALPDTLERSMESVVRYFAERWVHEDDRARLKSYAARERLLTEFFAKGQAGELEYRHQRAKGLYGWVRVSVQMLPDPYTCNVRAFLLFQDIDAQKREELSLHDRLTLDTLTGVLNRKAFIERTEALLAAIEPGHTHAFIMVDVDHFKHINDRFGHGYGDRVLTRVAETLQTTLRANDLVARMGGDEFVLLLLNVISREALVAKLIYLREQIFQRVSSDVVISCSFGAACCPLDGTTFDELYFKADVALYAAKEEGRNCARIYEGSMRPQALLEELGGGNAE